MPGLNLTRAEAAERSALLRVESYDIDLDFTAAGSADTFGSVTVIRFTAAERGASTFVDLVAERVREVTLNGRVLDPAEVYADGRVVLHGLERDNEVRIAADCAYSTSGQGLHRSVDPADGRIYLYTHFEVPDARRLFASFEQPDLRASFRFAITAPEGWTVLSSSPTPEAAPTGDGVATWTFEPTPRIPTYVTAVAAGDYHVVHDRHTTVGGTVIPMAVACRRSLARYLDPQRVTGIVKRGIDYFEARFGVAYPFAKYDQVFAPDYNIGAMENVGLVTITERYLFRSAPTEGDYQQRASTLLHELSHMWFGDLVTVRWWDDLWLKESFATYMGTRALADLTGWPVWADFANSGKTLALRFDQAPTTHPIVADINDLDDVAVNFDGITYSKGGAVLKQLAAWVGDEAFFTGAQRYFEAYAWGATALVDLLDALAATSGRDLSAWSRDWLETAGPNTLTPAYTQVEGRITRLQVEQSAPAEHPRLRAHRVAIGLYTLTSGGLERTSHVTVDVSGPSTPVPALVGAHVPDLVLVNDDDLTYAKVRFDDRSLATLREHLGMLGDPLARAVCWSALWDMVRCAELPAPDYIGIVLGAIDGESAIAVVEDLHGTLRLAIERYVAVERVTAAREAVAAAARDHLAAAVPGSDEQIAWVKLLIRIAAAEPDVAAVAGLLDGSRPVAGLDVDLDLRWLCVGTLARLGRIDESRVAAELAREHTAVAVEYAAGARAALASAAAKAAAWESIAAPDVAKRELDAVAGQRAPGHLGLGFVQPGQEELIEPYVERYFAALPGVWAHRTVENARSFVTGLYPSVLIRPDTLARTDEFLATSPPAALRRLLLECRDSVARSLAARDGDR